MDFFEEVKKKINKTFNPKSLILINNSHLHAKHKSFDINKYHIKLIIKSDKLSKMDKVTAHKEIYSVLKDEMSKKIHALEIEIK
jgi:stress-induced morphogen